MVEEKRKNKNKCQENVKFAIQLKESEEKIRELQEELRKQKTVNEGGDTSIDRKVQTILEDGSVSEVVIKTGVATDENNCIGVAMLEEDIVSYNK